MNVSVQRIAIYGVLLSALIPVMTSAAVYTVRQDGTGDFTEITPAIAAASFGDTVEVDAGTYFEELIITTPLTLRSTFGAASTFLDGQNTFRPLTIDTAAGIVVKGFTIRNGSSIGGGGVRVRNGGATVISDCIIQNNWVSDVGGGFMVKGPGSRLEIIRCQIIGNFASLNGGGGEVAASGNATVTDCVFRDNSTDNYAAALACQQSIMDISGCEFWNNRSGNVGAALYYYQGSGTISNNTFHENEAGGGGDAGTVVLHESSGTWFTRNIISGTISGYGLLYKSTQPFHSCNLFWDNSQGDIGGSSLDSSEISDDPLYCMPSSGQFTLSETSPAAPSNNTCGVLFGAYSVVCGPVAVRETTWGEIKSRYR